MHNVSRLALLAGALALGFPGCKNNDITVIRVPKEAEPTIALKGASAHREADWTVPPSWREQAAGGMRVGSFLAKGSAGGEVEITVVPLSGEAGSELANVNRWRGQLGLAPVDQAGLGALVSSRRVGAHAARLVEFPGEGKKRLLAAILRHRTTTWFFKASGDDAAVREIKPAFLAFVESVRFHDHE